MPTLRTIRVQLPSALLQKLAARTGAEKASVGDLIVRAVQSDLKREAKSAAGKLRGRRPGRRP